MRLPRPLKVPEYLGVEALEALPTVPVCVGRDPNRRRQCGERVWRLGWMLCEACHLRHLDLVRTAPRSRRGHGPLPPRIARSRRTRNREGALYTRCTELLCAGLLHAFNVVDADLWQVQYDEGAEPVEYCSDVLRKELADRYGDAALGTGFFVYGRPCYWERAT